MRPVYIDENLHSEAKIAAVKQKEKFYELMNRYTLIGLWYDTLDKSQKQAIDEEVNKFLIDKDLNG